MKEYELYTPQWIKESLERYKLQHVDPGDFLQAVLSNDLMESFGRADERNRELMFYICSYVYNEIPLNMCRSRKNVNEWLAKRNISKGGG